MAVVAPAASSSASISPRSRSRTAAAEAGALGLANVRLLQGDVAALPDDLGRFDYVIAHGLYSWVPLPVRDGLLAAARALLAPHGVAYVSYNAYPGSYLRDMVRDVLRFHVERVDDPAQRIGQARSLMELIVAANREPGAGRLHAAAARPAGLGGVPRRAGRRQRRRSSTSSPRTPAPRPAVPRRGPPGRQRLQDCRPRSRRSSRSCRTTSSSASSTSTSSPTGCSGRRCCATRTRPCGASCGCRTSWGCRSRLPRSPSPRPRRRPGVVRPAGSERVETADPRSSACSAASGGLAGGDHGVRRGRRPAARRRGAARGACRADRRSPRRAARGTRDRLRAAGRVPLARRQAAAAVRS